MRFARAPRSCLPRRLAFALVVVAASLTWPHDGVAQPRGARERSLAAPSRVPPLAAPVRGAASASPRTTPARAAAAPTFVPAYARGGGAGSRGGWARSPAAVRDQLRTELRWHRGSGTAIALRLAAHLAPGRRDQVVSVPVGSLRPVHAITPGDAQLGARVDQLRAAPAGAFAGSFSMAAQQRYFAAVTPIQVVRDTAGRYFVLDGNLRHQALLRALGPSQRVDVRLINADSRAVSSLVRRLRRVRGLDE